MEKRYGLAYTRPSPVPRPRPYVLNVAARFSYRKNQLSVIKALRNATLNVVFIGRATNSVERRYLDECVAQSTSHMTFINRPLSESDLIPLYQQARVHVLASWFETPGLVSLEAAMAGCAIVSTNRGSASE
ncbi:MAG: glycosyltransferase, partial [Mycobacterium sp.]